jgi:putative ABC transport system permease protein
LLAGIGTAAGVLMAIWSVDAVRLLGAGRIPRLDAVRIDGMVLGFACLAGIVSCVLFGLAPAIHAARADLRSSIGDGHRYTVSGRRLRHGLVILEVALALLLLVTAGLMANSFMRLMSADPGFETATTIAMPLELPASRYPEDRVAPFYADVIERVAAVPGVHAAAATSTNPFRQYGFSNSVTPQERAAEAPPTGLVQAGWRSVTPGFFETMRIPLLSGRDFNAFDRLNSERVVIVSRSLAERLWPGETAVGKEIYWGGTTGRTRKVVGVAGDIRDVQLDTDTSAMVFLPHAQIDLAAMTIVLRADGDMAALAPALRDIVRRLDSTFPAPPIYDVSDSRIQTAAGPRFNLALLGAFAITALVLAATGVYAMLAFTVAERRREIAVRLALGASSAGVARLVLRNGLLLTAIGVAAGAVGALAGARVLASLLYDVAPTDPATFIAACIVLLFSAAIACVLPARQAMRLDPIIVLRDN